MSCSAPCPAFSPLATCLRSDRHRARLRAAAAAVWHPGRRPRVVALLSSPVVITAWGTDYPNSAVVSYIAGAVACLAMPCSGPMALGLSRGSRAVLLTIGDLVPRHGHRPRGDDGRRVRDGAARCGPATPCSRRRGPGGGQCLDHARPHGRLGACFRPVRLHPADLRRRRLLEPAGTDTAVPLRQLALGSLRGVPAGSSFGHRHVRGHLRTQAACHPDTPAVRRARVRRASSPSSPTCSSATTSSPSRCTTSPRRFGA